MNPPEMRRWNLALRFGLEVAALVAYASTAWRVSDGPWRWVAVIAVPLAITVAWGTFNVPGDPSRSGAAPVRVPGGLRLGLELAALSAAAAAFLAAGSRVLGIVLASLVVVHYASSIPRIRWLTSR